MYTLHKPLCEMHMTQKLLAKKNTYVHTCTARAVTRVPSVTRTRETSRSIGTSRIGITIIRISRTLINIYDTIK